MSTPKSVCAYTVFSSVYCILCFPTYMTLRHFLLICTKTGNKPHLHFSDHKMSVRLIIPTYISTNPENFVKIGPAHCVIHVIGLIQKSNINSYNGCLWAAVLWWNTSCTVMTTTTRETVQSTVSLINTTPVIQSLATSSAAQVPTTKDSIPQLIINAVLYSI